MIAAYIRVSTDDQDIELQHEAIVAWLARSSIDTAGVRWFEDAGRSGKTLRRPSFAAMMKAIEAGSVDTLVCYKLDRLARSMLDGMNLVAKLAEDGIRVVSITQQIDMSGIVGRMIASILFGFAQMEREMILERQRPGIDKAKRLGKYKGRKRGTTKGDSGRAKALRDKGLHITEIATSLGVCQRSVLRYLSAK